MTTIYPAMRAKFGTTEYYIITMRVSELAPMVMFPEEAGMRGGSIEEQFQRKLDMPRIIRDIAPYFATDEKRFSGSLVMAAMNDIQFETMSGIVDSDNIPYAYRNTISDLGFVVFDDQRLVPLDGQHRVKAFQTVMGWIEGGSHKVSDGFGDDIITILLIRFDKQLARYIFNKINKYAKPTSKAGKLITDDDDAMAVLSRSLVEDGPIPKRLINTEATSLSRAAHEFTLLSTFYNANIALLRTLPVPSMVKPQNMPTEELDMKRDQIGEEWERLICGIGGWKAAIQDPQESGDSYRREFREKSLLGRPICQLAIIKGYAYACKQLGATTHKDILIKKLNYIDWNINNGLWEGVLVKPNGRVMYGVRVANLASKLIAHMIGAELSQSDNILVLNHIYGTKRTKKRLPRPVYLEEY